MTCLYLPVMQPNHNLCHNLKQQITLGLSEFLELLPQEGQSNPQEQAGHICARLLIPALGRQRQVDICEFEASLVYKS